MFWKELGIREIIAIKNILIQTLLSEVKQLTISELSVTACYMYILVYILRTPLLFRTLQLGCR